MQPNKVLEENANLPQTQKIGACQAQKGKAYADHD